MGRPLQPFGLRVLSFAALAGSMLAAPIHGQAPAASPASPPASGQTPAGTPAGAAPAGAAPAAGAPAAGASTTGSTSPEDSKAVIEDIKKQDEAVMSGRGGYTYDPAGRRDPFVDPLNAKTPDKEEIRPEGSEGMLINEVQLQGITIYGGDPIAVLMGTDEVGYFLREGDELWDGKIIAIDFDEGKIVFQQKVEDPSSPVRFREVVKKLVP